MFVNKRKSVSKSKFGKIYISSPGSRGFSEMLLVFPEAGIVFVEERNRLLPINAEKNCFH